MDNLQIIIESPDPRPVSEEEVRVLLRIMPPKLIKAIAMIGNDEPDLAERR
jgi:hypothetical protein